MYGNVSQYLAYKAIYEFDIFADVCAWIYLLSNGCVFGYISYSNCSNHGCNYPQQLVST